MHIFKNSIGSSSPRIPRQVNQRYIKCHSPVIQSGNVDPGNCLSGAGDSARPFEIGTAAAAGNIIAISCSHHRARKSEGHSGFISIGNRNLIDVDAITTGSHNIFGYRISYRGTQIACYIRQRYTEA